MKHKILASAAATLIAITFFGSAGVSAQGQDRDRGRDRSTDLERIQDREQDRTADRDRLQDRDQDRLEDRDRDQDRDGAQDRDQPQVQDRDHLRNRDIYGSELMTRQERREYQERIREMGTVQEWARYRAEHQARMMARAREQGVELPEPFYGQQLMTDQERKQLRERLRDAASDQDRERIRAAHREQMLERAREYQIPLGQLE